MLIRSLFITAIVFIIKFESEIVQMISVAASATTPNLSPVESGEAERLSKRDDDDYDDNYLGGSTLLTQGDDKEKYNEISFEEVEEWKVNGPKCDPKKNSFTSPIEISTKDVVRVKNTETLLVYADPPKPQTYVFSTMFKTEMYELEGFSLRLKNEDVVRDAAYIGGLGVSEHRFFDQALFFFRPFKIPGEKPEIEDPTHRFHTVDGVTFPMEIMFTFKTNLNQHVTQIHVLVELSDAQNPAWVPIINKIEDLQKNILREKCVGERERKESKREMDLSYRDYMTKLHAQQRDLDGSTYAEYYTELTEVYEAVKFCDKNVMKSLRTQFRNAETRITKCGKNVTKLVQLLKISKEEMIDLKNMIHEEVKIWYRLDKEKRNATAVAAAAVAAEKDAAIAVTAANDATENSTSKVKRNANDGDKAPAINDQLEEQTKKLKDLETTLHEQKMLYKTYQMSHTRLTTCVSDNEKIVANVGDELDRKKRLLADYKIGKDPQDLFDSVEELNRIRLETRDKAMELNDLNDVYFKASDQFDEVLAIQQRSTVLEFPFHISWLFPDRGGHYFYNGSSPIPPCLRRPHVILFEDKIQISESQLLQFSSFPRTCLNNNMWASVCEDSSNEDSQLDQIATFPKINNCLPIINPLGNRTVWYNPRNLQYKGDDGMHMKSNVRRVRKLNTSPYTGKQ